MNNFENKFSTPHFVALKFFKKDQQRELSRDEVTLHRAYYQQLEIKNKLIFYGDILNEAALYIVVSVSCDDEFEQIIAKDPGINSSIYELKAITPFFSMV